MSNRCAICGTPVNHVKICNYCSTVKEERRFMKMVNREELKASRDVADISKNTTSGPNNPFR